MNKRITILDFLSLIKENIVPASSSLKQFYFRPKKLVRSDYYANLFKCLINYIQFGIGTFI